MSPKKLILLTAVVAALFAFIVLFERKMPTTSEQQRKGDLYWDLPQERVTRLTLTRGDEVLEFDRAESAPWRMVKPAAYPADALAVNAVVTELAELKRSGGDTADAKLSDYGLEKPSTRASFVWTEAGAPKAPKTRTLDFGLEVPGTDIASARVEGEDKVLFIPSSVLTSVRKPVDDFRSKDVFGGSSADVTRLEVLRGRGRQLPLSRLLADAIAYAEDGVPVTDSFSEMVAEKRLELESVPGFKAQFLAGGLPQSGAILKNKALGAMLRHLASAGLGDFYRGDIARSMAKDLEAAGSPLAAW